MFLIFCIFSLLSDNQLIIQAKYSCGDAEVGRTELAAEKNTKKCKMWALSSSSFQITWHQQKINIK
jgi:hypothetical protein